MPVTDDLITWLRACLDDDERVARAAGRAPWQTSPNGSITRWISGDSTSWDRWVIASVGAHSERKPSDSDARHIARWDPARVLAEIDAKRRILDLHANGGTPPLSAADECRECISDYPCPTVRLLTLPFADRPGYREEWRP